MHLSVLISKKIDFIDKVHNMLFSMVEKVHFMKKFSHFILGNALALGLLAGCAIDKDQTSVHGLGAVYQSTVKAQPDGSYYVEAEAAPTAGRQSGADQAVTSQATDFCAQRKQKMTMVNKEFDSHLVVNAVARLTFKCE